MKINTILLIPVLIFLVCGCGPKSDYSQVLIRMHREFDSGNLIKVRQITDSLHKVCPSLQAVLSKADSLSAMSERIALDFSLSEPETDDRIRKRGGAFSEEDKKRWEDKGWLEHRQIDGRKMYFNRAVSNLFLLRKFYEDKELRNSETAEDPEMIFRLNHTKEACRMSAKTSDPVVPVNMNITYTISVHPDVVPDGETIRCWMPWPKANHLRQKNIKLISTSPMEYSIAPDTAIHSSLYMEAKAVRGMPSIFTITYSYQSNAQHFNTDNLNIKPYDKSSDIYTKYTSEQLPQINFASNVRHLADSITGDEVRPLEVARKIYMWFKENIPWTGALEYSVMPDIPEYVCHNRRGDCGMQTLLYMSMLRYKGIPVRWQSGWMVPPGTENLHDWCEIYFEGAGWIPSDVSYDLQASTVKELREYYFSGLDSYRLIVNDGISGNFHPAKLFMRSEPYDFQRGEVEWKGGNLYFDKWDYKIKIDYIK